MPCCFVLCYMLPHQILNMKFFISFKVPVTSLTFSLMVSVIAAGRVRLRTLVFSLQYTFPQYFLVVCQVYHLSGLLLLLSCLVVLSGISGFYCRTLTSPAQKWEPSCKMTPPPKVFLDVLKGIHLTLIESSSVPSPDDIHHDLPLLFQLTLNTI